MSNAAKCILDSFRATKGLAMPPIQLYASYLAFLRHPYNTGLYGALDGETIIALDQLMYKSCVAASEAGMAIPNDFAEDTGTFMLDPPQVASILASAIGEMIGRHGSTYRVEIMQWARDTFDSILPPLDATMKEYGVCEMLAHAERSGLNNAGMKKLKENGVDLMADESTSPVNFLMKKTVILYNQFIF